eukprot:1147004-Pelagomonas_calceolata.AAC.2
MLLSKSPEECTRDASAYAPAAPILMCLFVAWAAMVAGGGMAAVLAGAGTQGGACTLAAAGASSTAAAAAAAACCTLLAAAATAAATAGTYGGHFPQGRSHLIWGRDGDLFASL